MSPTSTIKKPSAPKTPVDVDGTPAPTDDPMVERFTLDGDSKVEQHLQRVCDKVRSRLQKCIPRRRLQAILLGGGYGRGEGGVLRTDGSDKPYNDLEFYLFLRGSRHLNERRYGKALHQLEHDMTEFAGIEVEFKIISRKWLRRSPVTMFSYDLVMGHRTLLGPDKATLAGCGHHCWATKIPLAEATRLLMNRCTGLLFAMELLEKADFSADDADFVMRNLAKLRLGLGDAVVAAHGRYHWSCSERQERLQALPVQTSWDWFGEVLLQHRLGSKFKLHPWHPTEDRETLRIECEALAALAGRVWLWLEGWRLGSDFDTFDDYVYHRPSVCPETSAVRNCVVNLRQFGLLCLTQPRKAFRYPRERLLRSLPVLLWDRLGGPDDPRHTLLQQELRTQMSSFKGYVASYRALWEIYR